MDKAIQKLEAQGVSLTKIRKRGGPPFIEGSSLLLVEGTARDSKDLVLEDYFGYRQPHHDNRGAYTIRFGHFILYIS